MLDLDVLSSNVTIPLSLLVILLGTFLSYSRSSQSPLPPRPKSHFLIGNLWDVEGHVKTVCQRQHELCKQLDTDILYLNVFGNHMVILDTYEACVELLETRSSTFSGRPRYPMLNELMGWDFDFTFMDYGNTWRLHRKLMYQRLNPTAVTEYRPQQIKASRRLVKRLLNGCDDFMTEARQMTGELILSITYGIDVKSPNDTYLKLAEAGVQPLLEAGVPGAFLVDTFPIMKYIPAWAPGANFRRKARGWKRAACDMVDVPFYATKTAIAKGKAVPSMVMKCLDELGSGKVQDMNEWDVKSAAGTMYQTGVDTTAVMLTSCILALLEYPEVMKKAQQEIDSVVLPGYAPDITDEESLPYTSAIIKEVLRWKALAPIAVPHCTNADEICKGYFIPKGTTVTPNVWAILHNEQVFPDPESFIPERFMKNDEVAETHLQAAWGFGRRICPGRFLAVPSVFITLISLLSVYDILKPVDEDGNVIHPSHEFSSSILPVPVHPVKAVFKVRNKEAVELVKGFE